MLATWRGAMGAPGRIVLVWGVLVGSRVAVAVGSGVRVLVGVSVAVAVLVGVAVDVVVAVAVVVAVGANPGKTLGNWQARVVRETTLSQQARR